MDKRNRVILGMVGAAVIGSGIFCNNVLAANTTDSEFSVSITPSATLTIPSAPINLIVNPSATGQFASGSFNITAYTNSTDGLTVTMSTSSTALVSDTVDVTTGDPYTIPTLSNTATESNFEMNRWGVSLDSGANYIPMPATSNSGTIIDEDEPTGAAGVTQAVSYATKLDFGTVPGTYSTTINFTATAKIDTSPAGVQGGSINENGNYPANTLARAFEIAYANSNDPIYIEDANATNGWRRMTKNDDITNKKLRFAMQDIAKQFTEGATTQNVCAWANSSTANSVDELRVIDIRDGKEYWIIKAADNRCWMTQNLDLDLNQTFTDADTDLNSVTSWTPANSTDTTTPDFIGDSGGVNASTPKSFDPGAKYVVTSGDTTKDTIYTSLNDCLTNGTRTEDLCSHYALGNFYNWTAAIATNDSSAYDYSRMDDSAPDSVCPAGWRLPEISSNFDYTAVLNASGVSTGSGAYASFVSGGFNKIRTTPLYFVRGGDGIDATNLTTGTMGVSGTYWSSNAGDYEGPTDAGAVGMLFKYESGSAVLQTSQYYLAREQGYSVRCIAR